VREEKRREEEETKTKEKEVEEEECRSMRRGRRQWRKLIDL
jgi:hypothetical protein